MLLSHSSPPSSPPASSLPYLASSPTSNTHSPLLLRPPLPPPSTPAFQWCRGREDPPPWMLCTVRNSSLCWILTILIRHKTYISETTDGSFRRARWVEFHTLLICLVFFNTSSKDKSTYCKDRQVNSANFWMCCFLSLCCFKARHVQHAKQMGYLNICMLFSVVSPRNRHLFEEYCMKWFWKHSCSNAYSEILIGRWLCTSVWFFYLDEMCRLTQSGARKQKHHDTRTIFWF